MVRPAASDERASREIDDDDDADWIEVRRFDDAIGATMIHDFLRDHGVRVALRGNPQATRMTWSETTDVLRIVVAPGDVELAREALAAMSAGDAHPFRGPSPPPEDGPEEVFVKPRSAIGAAVFALLVPIGAGHFYARHGAAGTILLLGIFGAIASILFGHAELFRAWAILLVIDAVFAFWAVRRLNENRIPPESVQRKWAMGAVVVAYAASWLLAR